MKKRKHIWLLLPILLLIGATFLIPQTSKAVSREPGVHYYADNGKNGDAGDSGDSGDAGDNGDSGDSGKTGDKGKEGDKGKDGTEKKKFDVQRKDPTDDTDEIYKRYKNNSFTLMNKEFTGLAKLFSFVQNFSAMWKTIWWGGVVMTGRVNTVVTHQLFSLDIASAIKDPIQQLTLKISTNLTNVATSVGLAAIVLFMLARYVTTQDFKKVFQIFLMTILTFVAFAFFNNPSSNKYFFDSVISIDNYLEESFAGINPQFSPNEKQVAADSENKVADKISAEVFKNNVYLPYLYMQYGTTDMEKIRESKIDYQGEEYDRIGALLDNDSSSEEQLSFTEEVTNYEVDTLGNNNPTFKNSFILAGISTWYIISNVIQLFIFGILGLLRLALQVLLIFLPAMLPVCLATSLILMGHSILPNFLKGLGTVMLLKASLTLVTITFTSYISLGYSTANVLSDPITAIITMIVWILAPFIMYYFRGILGSIFSQNMRMGMIMSGGFMNPMKYNRQRKLERANEKEQRKKERDDAREKFKKKREQEEKDGQTDSKNDLKEVTPSKITQSDNRNNEARQSQADSNENEVNQPNESTELNESSKREARKPTQADSNNEKNNELKQAAGQVSDRSSKRVPRSENPKETEQKNQESSPSTELKQPKNGNQTNNQSKRKERSAGTEPKQSTPTETIEQNDNKPGSHTGNKSQPKEATTSQKRNTRIQTPAKGSVANSDQSSKRSTNTPTNPEPAKETDKKSQEVKQASNRSVRKEPTNKRQVRQTREQKSTNNEIEMPKTVRRK